MKSIQAIFALAIAAIALVSFQPANAAPASSSGSLSYRYGTGTFQDVDLDVINVWGGTVVNVRFKSTRICTPKVSLYRSNGRAPVQAFTGKSGTYHYASFVITDEFKEFKLRIDGVGGALMISKTTDPFLSFGLGLSS